MHPGVLNKFFQKYGLNIFVGKEFFPFNKINNKNLRVEFSASKWKGCRIL